MTGMARRALGLVVVAVALVVAGCSDGGSDSSDDTTTTASEASPPLALASAVPAPQSVTYISEASIDTTGYWTGYTNDGDFDLSTFGDRLGVLGWTVGDVDDTSLSATMEGAWLDVAVSGDDIGVCVFNAEPDDGACADFPASLAETTTTTTG